ncbi:hypothetical protein PRIPAC_85099 [Pristionchus pacificus]|uniref:Endo/exonuclease/phosphatase domain-containing protein n=1 Tax=Pristionchus pacificus TaxID=54126 RepID=A0A2A6BVG8_PRIPA|nr:hypothetical protein PRIPAC_85099 [Pristionchus pacificus]|eukprot:PDM69751.1 hypothetical protein PRIPAC_44847 [Pristionchus pacificus]
MTRPTAPYTTRPSRPSVANPLVSTPLVNYSFPQFRNSRSPDPQSIFYANCRSIRSKSHHLSFLLSSFTYRIISLCETWLDVSNGDALLIGQSPEFLSFRNDRVISNEYGRGGGVALIVHNSLSPALVSSFSSLLFEAITVDLHIDYRNDLPFRKIRIITVYRSPSSPAQSLSSFIAYLTHLLSSDFPCIILGDFNLPHINWLGLSSPSQNDLPDFVSDHHFSQFVPFPTRFNNFLDLVFCDRDIIHNVSPLLPISDHLSVGFELRIPSPPPRHYVPSRVYRLADWTTINSCIFNHDWTVALRDLNATDSFIYFVEFVNNVLDSCVPLSKPSSFCRYPRNTAIALKPRPFLCEHCPATFTTEFSFEKHVYTQASIAFRTDKRCPASFKCSRCALPSLFSRNTNEKRTTLFLMNASTAGGGKRNWRRCVMPTKGGMADPMEKLLSGVITFRIEVFPVLLQHVPTIEKVGDIKYPWYLNSRIPQARCYRKCLRFLHDWEERLLAEVRSTAQGSFSKFGVQAPVGSHALYVHSWWHGKFEVARDIEENYELDD